MIFKPVAKRILGAIGLTVFRNRTMPRGISLENDLHRLFAGHPLQLIFDVGANLGQTALRLAKEFPSTRIHSFEPVPSTYRLMLGQVLAYPHIVPINLALGDKDGQVEMQQLPGSGCNRIIAGHQEAGGPTTAPVPIQRLDTYCQEHAISAIDLVKTDCEGYDHKVLQGASSLLERQSIAALYCEVNFRRDGVHGDFFAIEEYLRSFGYSFYALYDYSGWQYDTAIEGFANAFFVSSMLSAAATRNRRNL